MDKIQILGVNKVTGRQVVKQVIKTNVATFDIREFVINHNCDISDNISYSWSALDYLTYRIPIWAIIPLKYGDYSGLSESEIKEIKDFGEDLPQDVVGGFDWEIDVESDKFFAITSDILYNIGDEVVDVRFYYID